jgi:DNA gyrase subunit A
MVTKRGVIKRTLLSEYEYQRKGGKRALTLDEGDELLFIRHTKGGTDLLLATRQGLATRFTEENVRCMGRIARGVRGIALAEGDEVVGVVVVEEGKQFLTITEKGYGKRSDFDDFRSMKNRGGHGVQCHNISEKTGLLAGIASVTEEDDLMLITSDGVIIRTPASGIPTYSRTAGGVIVMRLYDDVKVVNLAPLPKEEDTLEEIEAAPEVVEVAPELPDSALPTEEETEEAPAGDEGDDE